MESTSTTPPGLKKVDRMVNGFLMDLAEMEPNRLDCVALEKLVMEVVRELGRTLMGEVMRRADENAPEVMVNGGQWGNRIVSKGTYTTKYGDVTLDRSGYQQSGRGKMLFPVDLRLGIVEGRYTPGVARTMAHGIAVMPAEEAEGFLEEVGLVTLSKSTFHRIPQDMSAVYERDRVEIDALVRAEWRPPAATFTVQAGMDGVMVSMDGEHTKPRGRKTDVPDLPRHERHYGVGPSGPATSDNKGGAPYHEASVGTLSFWDAAGECLETVYLARMPEYRKETLAADLEEELKMALAQLPAVQVAFASDGAPTHWEHLSGMQERLPDDVKPRSRQLLDFYHGAKYLFDAGKLVHGDTAEAIVVAEGMRSNLRHRKDGADVVIRSLRYHRDASTDEDARDTLGTIVDFFVDHRKHGRLDYKAAANDAFPIGSGATEAAAKSVVNVRMKRSGARYSSHGGQTILNFRAALLSRRLPLVMREVVSRYSANVLAA